MGLKNNVDGIKLDRGPHNDYNGVEPAKIQETGLDVMNVGTISYCELLLSSSGNANFVNMFGFRSIELGSPSGQNKSVSGSGGCYAVIDDIETAVYRNASITCVEGSDCDMILRLLFTRNNYGSQETFKYRKNCNKGGNVSVVKTTDFEIRCFTTDGQRTGYSSTGNGDDVALVTYGMELQVTSVSFGA